MFFKEVRTATPQWRVLAIFGVAAALAAAPVYMHSRGGGGARSDAYAAAKKKARDDKLRWMHSDEMPSPFQAGLEGAFRVRLVHQDSLPPAPGFFDPSLSVACVSLDAPAGGDVDFCETGPFISLVGPGEYLVSFRVGVIWGSRKNGTWPPPYPRMTAIPEEFMQGRNYFHVTHDGAHLSGSPYKPKLLAGTVNAQVSFVDPVGPTVWAASAQAKSVGQLVALCDAYGNFIRDLDAVRNISVRVTAPLPLSSLASDLSWYSINWYINIKATAYKTGLYGLQVFYRDREGQEQAIRVKHKDGDFADNFFADVRPRSMKNLTFSGALCTIRCVGTDEFENRSAFVRAYNFTRDYALHDQDKSAFALNVSGGVLVDVLFLDLGVADIHVRFSNAGLQLVRVSFDDAFRFNCTIGVYHGSASPTTSSVALAGNRAGEVSGIAVVSDEYGNPVVSGVHLRMTRGNQSFSYRPPHGGGGNYTQLFPIYKAGKYLLELLYSGVPVKASEVVIRPGSPDAYLSSIEGSGLGNSQLEFGGCDYRASPSARLFAAGVSYALHVEVRDAWNNSYQDIAIAQWDPRFASHISSVVQIRDGAVDVVFIPRVAGHDLPFVLSVDGVPMFSTSASIVPGPPAEMSVAVPDDQGRAGSNINLEISMADSEGNPLSCCCAAMERAILFTDEGGQTSRMAARSLYYSGREEVSATLPTVPGLYALRMQAGDLERSVSSFLVRAGSIDPAGSYLRMAENRSIGSIDLILVMVDRFNNSAPSLASITNITIIPDAAVAVSVGAADILITATNFTRAGEHLVYASVDFEPISTYPFRFVVVSNEPAALSSRLVSRTALIAIGATCAACGVIFITGFCVCERAPAALGGISARARPLRLKRQML